MTFPYVGEMDEAEPASEQGAHGHDYMTAPTGFTGFARITDAALDADYYVTPGTFAIDVGMITGTVTCE